MEFCTKFLIIQCNTFTIFLAPFLPILCAAFTKLGFCYSLATKYIIKMCINSVLTLNSNYYTICYFSQVFPHLFQVVAVVIYGANTNLSYVKLNIAQNSG